MSSLLPFIVVGLAAGSLYGLAATGLVLTYRTSGILNFAHGALATVAVYVFYDLRTSRHWPWPLAAGVAVLVVGPLMGLIMERISARLSQADAVLQVVGTIGLILIVEAACQGWKGKEFISISPYLSTTTFKFSGVFISYGQVIVFAIALVCTVALFMLLRYTRVGVLMRAVVDSPELLDLSGVRPGTVRRSAWVIGATFAALSGVLLAPTVSLDAIVLIFLVVQAFGACAVGRFSSLPITYLGGMVIGVAASLAAKYVGEFPKLSGLPASVPFIVLFVVLLVTPRGRLAPPGRTGRRTYDRWNAPWRFQALVLIVLVAVLCFVPSFAPFRITLWSSALTFAITFLSLGLLVKGARQVSLAHLVLCGVGAAAFSHLSVNAHLPWLVALLLAGLITVPVGAFVAFPASRLPGAFLALATLGFGIMFEQMLYGQSWFFGTGVDGIKMPRPKIGLIDFSRDRNFYYLILTIAVLLLISVSLLLRSRFGRLLTAMAESPLALRTNGTDIATVRILVFCLSAFLAGIAGALFGMNVTVVSTASYTTAASLFLVAVLATQRGGELFYPIIGGIAYQVFGVYVHLTDGWQLFLFGAFSLFVAINPYTENTHVPKAWRRSIDRVFGRPLALSVDGSVAAPAFASAASGITVEGLTVNFGGVRAVNDLSLEAPSGRVTGLIGPNGAGKTTTFNACSGLLRPRQGVIKVGGQDVSQLSAHRRARLGLGRTFQRIELFDSMSVYDNVRLGVEARLAGRNPIRTFISRGEPALVARAVQEAVELCGLTPLLERPAGILSTGQRRIVELARVLAGGFPVLLLDEPSSGLDAHESHQFGQIIRRAAEARELAVLMVEHDMSLVMGICDYIYVLDFGSLLFEGEPSSVAASDIVRTAYLGAENPGAPAPAEAAVVTSDQGGAS